MALLADAPVRYQGRHSCRDKRPPADAVHARMQLERAAASLPHARSSADATLRAWSVPQRTRVRALRVLADLTANAVQHACPEPDDCDGLLLALSIADGRVRVEVGDFCNRLPGTPRAGSGLERVQRLAEQWGVLPAAHRPGKTVWAELPLHAPV